MERASVKSYPDTTLTPFSVLANQELLKTWDVRLQTSSVHTHAFDSGWPSATSEELSICSRQSGRSQPALPLFSVCFCTLPASICLKPHSICNNQVAEGGLAYRGTLLDTAAECRFVLLSNFLSNLCYSPGNNSDSVYCPTVYLK